MEKEQPDQLKCPHCYSMVEYLPELCEENSTDYICQICGYRWSILSSTTMESSREIKIKYFDKEMPELKPTEGTKSDWIDLRAAETIELKKGEFKLIPLGVAMQLPEGYEAHVVPRSSTFKNFKILQTNSVGIIDNSFSGNSDQWFFPALAIEDTVVNRFDRICQFRIVKKQPQIEFTTVESLGNPDRGGHGSTGVI